MFVLHFNGSVQSFPTLKRAVNFLSDLRRKAPKPCGVFIVDMKATEDYTVPHPSDKKKPTVFVRANPTLELEAIEAREVAGLKTAFSLATGLTAE